MKKDIKTREDIFLLISTFYKKVRRDKQIGHFFNNAIKNWDEHLEKLTTFWEKNLFLRGKYTGDPLVAHVKVDKENEHSITQLHFGIWLNLWFQTIDELFEGDYAKMRSGELEK